MQASKFVSSLLCLATFLLPKIALAQESKTLSFTPVEIEALLRLQTIHEAGQSGQNIALLCMPLKIILDSIPPGQKKGKPISKAEIAKMSLKVLEITPDAWQDVTQVSLGLKKIELLAAKKVCVDEAATVKVPANKKFWNEMARRYDLLVGKLPK